MAKYLIKTALHQEAKEGWVWVKENSLGNHEDKEIPFIKIAKGNKSIICERRYIDKNFAKVYKDSTSFDCDIEKNILIISEYYRKKLGIAEQKNMEVELEITEVKDILSNAARYFLNHPNAAIRGSYKIGLLGLLIGIVACIPLILDVIKFLFKIWILICHC